MSDPLEKPREPEAQRHSEYQDFQYHDEDESIGDDNPEYRRSRVPAKRKPSRKSLPRRPHYED